MDPYRGAYREERAEAPRDPGIVGDIIGQFADPHAFYRELVQNAIDAGSPSVDVRIEYDDGAGVLRASVRDRGEGMTRDILENQLLVLFRSTKDRDATKIGKFGIGFASVLAPEPEVVAVQTARDGRRLVLHLNRDLTYQLFDAGPATQTGTTVELDIRMRRDQTAAFVAASTRALERWCRHASVPIHLTTPDGDAPRRIDRPLGLDDVLVEVSGSTDGGRLSAVVGVPASGHAYTGFFNHGLMLHETAEPLLGHVAVKLQDARLGHTLSRDDVRRDTHFERAIGLARSLVERELPAAAATALRGAAEAGDRARWLLLARAIATSKLALAERAWWFPLVEPLGDRHAIAGSDLPRTAWASDTSTDATRMLALAGKPVVFVPPGSGDRAFAMSLVGAVTRCELRAVAGELTSIVFVEPADPDVVLLAKLRELLALAHRAPARIRIGRLAGVYADALAVTCDPEDESTAQVVDRDDCARNPFGRKRRALVLSEAHAWYRAARALDPRLGASMLARALLLGHRLLDVSRSTLLLERALDEIDLEGK